jgi:hypothetical protein
MRPTVNLGTKYRVAKGEAARAAATLRAGRERAAGETADRGRATKTRRRDATGTRAATRARRINPAPTTAGPAARQYQYTTE